jgi:hypothetical protein
MKKVDLGQIITIVANVGVIVGIGFLAYELRQNTIAAQMANLQSSYALGLETGSWLLDEDFAETYQLGLQDFSQLTNVQRLQFDEFFGQRLNIVEFAFYSRESGTFLEDNWVGWDAWLRSEIQRDALRNLWQASKREVYGPEFRTYVDSILSETQ